MAALIELRHRAASVLVSPPPAVAAMDQARCPPHTLEDNGVCLPLLRPAERPGAGTHEGWVAPEGLLGTFEVPWREAPLPEPLAGEARPDFRATMIRARIGSQVRCAAPFDDPVVSHLGKTTDSWVLTFVSKSDPVRTVSIANLTTVVETLRVGDACPKETPIGTSGDALVVWEGRLASPTPPAQTTP